MKFTSPEFEAKRGASFRFVQEIESKRPLLAPDMPMSDIVKEILDTYKAPPWRQPYHGRCGVRSHQL